MDLVDTKVEVQYRADGGVTMAKEKIPYGVYSREFREEAVRLVIESGFSVRQVGRSYRFLLAL